MQQATPLDSDHTNHADHNGYTKNTTLTDLPPGAEGHFLLHFYAVIARLLANLRTAPTEDAQAKYFEQFPFLNGYQRMLRSYMPGGVAAEEEGSWWDAAIAGWDAQSSFHLPLQALIDEADLSVDELRVLIAAGIVEEDIRFGALFAALQAPLPARRPCVGVLGWLLGESGKAHADAWRACHRLLEAGLLQVDNRADPRSEWILRIPTSIWDALRGQPLARPARDLILQPIGDFPPIESLILPEKLQAHIMRMPDLFLSGQVSSLVLRGMAGSGRRTMLRAVAQALGRDILLWEGGTPGDDSWRLLGSLATLIGAMPVLRCDPGPGETLDLPALPGYSGPVGITLGRSGGLRGPLIAHSLSLHVPAPDCEARRRFWLATTLPVEMEYLDDIAARFLLTGGHIARAASLAHTYALLDNRPAFAPTDVQQATRALNRQALETLATPLEAINGWSDLVVGASTSRDMQTLEARCKSREALRERTGPALSHSLNRGVRALFSGPSGTGKTLAARALAAALQMDLYRVDLAAVVNKYIGETERNLNQVLSRAEELDVMLLLDEGDALMTSRTEVRNANDRYANLETNYLLQRLENYEGIVVITTNAGNRIDSAFARRLDVVVDFAPPEAAERWLIWQSHLPANHLVSASFLEEVANRCALTGGQIRNAALHAILLAVSDAQCGGQVGDAHLEAAVQREYRKAGAVYPLHPKTTSLSQVDRLMKLAAGLG
jgi:hypothetical protein